MTHSPICCPLLILIDLYILHLLNSKIYIYIIRSGEAKWTNKPQQNLRYASVLQSNKHSRAKSHYSKIRKLALAAQYGDIKQLKTKDKTTIIKAKTPRIQTSTSFQGSRNPHSKLLKIVKNKFDKKKASLS